MADREWLRGVGVFKDLTDDELEAVGAICEERQFKSGDYVFKEGAGAEELFIMKRGKVAVDISVTGGKEVTVFTVGHSGEAFGWAALVDPFEFSASARCVKESTVVAVDGKRLTAFIDENFHAGYLIMGRISKLISRRLRDTRLQLIHCFYEK